MRASTLTWMQPQQETHLVPEQATAVIPIDNTWFATALIDLL